MNNVFSYQLHFIKHNRVMVFNASFNNTAFIPWRSVLLVEKTGVPGENHLAWVGFELTSLMVIGTDCIGSYKSNYHTITTTIITAVYIQRVNNNEEQKPGQPALYIIAFLMIYKITICKKRSWSLTYTLDEARWPGRASITSSLWVPVVRLFLAFGHRRLRNICVINDRLS